MHGASGGNQRVPQLRANLAGALSGRPQRPSPLSGPPRPPPPTPPSKYGKTFRALLASLYAAQVGASRRIRQMGQEMFGFAISEATLQKARQEQYDALEPFENRLVEILPQEALLHADETSVP